jgi:FkbM family methyltransferase
MTFLSQARETVERLTGLRIFRSLPAGVDLGTDISSFWDPSSFSIVCDVGAHVGRTALRFRRIFPGATILCFEPFADTFRVLSATLAGDPNTECLPFALAAEQGTREVPFRPLSVDNSIVPRGEGSPSSRETVRLTTLDAFAESRRLERIDFLKIDTEGGDFDVLLGAARLLGAGAVRFVQVESGMYAGNAKHVPFRQLADFLEERGYALFGLYEQVNDIPWSGLPYLRRADAVFVRNPEIGFRPGPLVGRRASSACPTGWNQQVTPPLNGRAPRAAAGETTRPADPRLASSDAESVGTALVACNE